MRKIEVLEKGNKTIKYFRYLEVYKTLDSSYEKILSMLNSMEMKSDKFCF